MSATRRIRSSWRGSQAGGSAAKRTTSSSVPALALPAGARSATTKWRYSICSPRRQASRASFGFSSTINWRYGRSTASTATAHAGSRISTSSVSARWRMPASSRALRKARSSAGTGASPRPWAASSAVSSAARWRSRFSSKCSSAWRVRVCSMRAASASASTAPRSASDTSSSSWRWMSFSASRARSRACWNRASAWRASPRSCFRRSRRCSTAACASVCLARAASRSAARSKTPRRRPTRLARAPRVSARNSASSTFGAISACRRCSSLRSERPSSYERTSARAASRRTCRPARSWRSCAISRSTSNCSLRARW